MREDTRYWRTLTEEDSLASQIIASVEDDDTHAIRAVIDCRPVNDDAASKFIGVSVATWLALIACQTLLRDNQRPSTARAATIIPFSDA